MVTPRSRAPWCGRPRFYAQAPRLLAQTLSTPSSFIPFENSRLPPSRSFWPVGRLGGNLRRRNCCAGPGSKVDAPEASAGPGWKVQEVSRAGAQRVTSKSKLLAREMPRVCSRGLQVDSGTAKLLRARVRGSAPAEGIQTYRRDMEARCGRLLEPRSQPDTASRSFCPRGRQTCAQEACKSIRVWRSC